MNGMGGRNMKSSHGHTVSLYRYKRWTRFKSAFLTFLSLVMGGSCIIVLIYSDRQFETGVLISVILFPLGLLYFVRHSFSLATVLIDEVGISARVLWIRTRTIKWKDMEKVKKVRALAPTRTAYFTGDYRDTYFFRDRYQGILGSYLLNVQGDICANSQIINYGDFVETINVHVRKNGVPLTVVDAQANTHRLRSVKGIEYLKQVLRRPPEVSVARF